MKKSKLLASVALAGMIMGAQVAVADHHEEGAKEEQGKNSCKGKNHCDGKDEKGKNHCKGKKEGANACSGMNGCDGKEHPAAPEKPKKP